MITKLASFLKHRKYKKAFLTDKGIGGFDGAYSSFSQAKEVAKKYGTQGYNHTEVAEWYSSNADDLKIETKDYPILFWLSKLVIHSKKVFDLGGNLGQHYHLFRSANGEVFRNVSWTVFDLPSIVERGEQKNKKINLQFTSSIEDNSEEHILIALGSIQYFEDVDLFFDNLKNEHILIASIPLHESKEFVTVQNGGPTYYPSRVFHRDTFLKKMRSLGYTVVDEWDDPISNCFIPFRPEESKARFYGFYFKRK